MEKENQRVRVSKTMLKEGLLKLLQEKNLSEITVHELCTTAQINRTTFYKYYGSILELLYDASADFCCELDGYVQTYPPDQIESLTEVLRYLYNHKRLFCLLSDALPSGKFADDLFEISSFNQVFDHAAQENHLTQMQTHYLRKYISHGTFAVLYEWLSGDYPESPEEFTGMITHLRKE